MPEWSTRCLDWQERIVAGRSLIPFSPLFPDEAEKALAVFKALRMVSVQDHPTVGEACRPWIFDFAGAFFGAYDADAGRRLITEFFLSVSKKNYKSGISAFIMLTLLIRNWRDEADFLILSPTIEVAGNSFKPARAAIHADEELSDIFQVQDHLRTITHREKGATLRVVAADSETVSGKIGTVVLIDEYWQFGKRANAENMLIEATGGQASRPEGGTIYLTTQSDEPPAGVFADKLKYARGVRDGRISDPKFLPVIYEFPEHMIANGAYKDPENWWMTNPNLGASTDHEFIAHKLQMAEEAGDGSVSKIEAKYLNVQIGLSLAADTWAGAAHWEHQSQAGLTLDYLLEHSEVVVTGIDGGGLDDLLALCAVGRDRETRGWLVWTHAWAHKIVMERRKSEAARFLDFARDGDLTIVDEIGKDIEQLADYVARIHNLGLLDKIGVDQHGIGAIVDAITQKGIEQERIVGISQGWKMVGAIKTAERKLAERTMTHGGQRMMTWCVGNAKVEMRGNALSITKQTSGSAKIDPLMAMFDAVSLMALNPEAKNLEPTMLFFGGGRSTQPTNEARR